MQRAMNYNEPEICVGLFGTLSGLAASLLLGSREEESAELKQILKRMEELDGRLNAARTSSVSDAAVNSQPRHEANQLQQSA
jgi:hypothetical protein